MQDKQDMPQLPDLWAWAWVVGYHVRVQAGQDMEASAFGQVLSTLGNMKEHSLPVGPGQHRLPVHPCLSPPPHKGKHVYRLLQV